MISKLITTLLIVVFGVTVFLPLTVDSPSLGAPREFAIVGSVSAFLAVVLFLIAFMGLQVSTSFVSSKTVDVLSPLPLTRNEVSRIIFLCFIRIFDLPLAAALGTFLTVYFLVGGSIFGGLVAAVAIVATEIFALTFTVSSAKFFYSKVLSFGGKSRIEAVLRSVFMFFWILPTFLAYILVNFAAQIVQSFAAFAQTLASMMQMLVLVYPFSFGVLVSYTTYLGGIDNSILGLSVVSSVAYLVIAYYSLRWVTRAIRSLGAGSIIAVSRRAVGDTVVKPQVPWLGIIRKDLRVASRAPSYASLFLLPVMQAIILAISFSSIPDVGLSATLGILVGISMITLLLPPTLLSIEGLASSYTRSLPLMKRTLISAKTLLSVLTYVISLFVLSIVAEYQGRNFSFILTFGAIHILAVAAAVMLEFTILTNKFWREGFAVGNIYSRLSTYVLIYIPGFAAVLFPMAVAVAAFFFASQFVIAAFLVTALVEFISMATVVLRQK
jgi:hypothetical protein